MRHRLALMTAVAAAALMVTGSAYAFDCIRVSSSPQGLAQSARSGNWLPFDLSTAENAQASLASVGVALTAPEAECFAGAYATSGQPLYFAIGIGVAGPNGVLAHNNGGAAVGDGSGVDHLESSGIFPAFFAAAGSCGIPV